MAVAVRAVWEHFAHGADIGIRGVGPTKEDAFQQVALALTGVVTDPAAVRPVASVSIACEAPSDELLLVDWLNALVYEMATRRMLFGAFDVTIVGTHLDAIVGGEPIDRARHQPAVEIKGATFTALTVSRTGAGQWRVQCVIDV